jgi:hypothetical protein
MKLNNTSIQRRTENDSIHSMESFDQVIRDLKKFPPLVPRQQDNVSRLVHISNKFAQRIGINTQKKELICPETIVLESGHQPNFLPHCGTWKKGFLLSRVKENLEQQGAQSVAFFGFADQNLSTAKLLYRNRIPALNKDGSESIGFKIDENNRFKSFWTLPKPSVASWSRETERLKNYYYEILAKQKNGSETSKSQLDNILGILWKSYDLAENFADLNSIVFAKISTEILGADLCFYRYSDLRSDRLFVDESIQLLRHLTEFNTIYNQVSQEKKIAVPPVAINHVPYWYQCSCGTKIELNLDISKDSTGHCPACNEEYHLSFGEDFERFSDYYSEMDFNAVSRSIIVAEGLGDSLFIPGAGGSLGYGKITREISKALCFRNPTILSWRSADYYLGPAHTIILGDLAKNVSRSPLDFVQPGMQENIRLSIQKINDKIADAESKNIDKREIKILKNNFNFLINSLGTAKKIFSLVPSAIDILVSSEPNQLISQWDQALQQGKITPEDEVFMLKSDIVYPTVFSPEIVPDTLPTLYCAMQGIEV